MSIIINPFVLQGGHLFYRLAITSWGGTGTQGEIAEIELFLSSADQIPAMTSATTSGVTMTGTDVAVPGTSDGWKAGDKIGSTVYGTANRIGTKYLTVEFSTATVVDTYTLTARFNGYNYPVAWRVEVSEDGVTYVTVDTQTGQTFTAAEKKTFVL